MAKRLEIPALENLLTKKTELENVPECLTMQGQTYADDRLKIYNYYQTVDRIGNYFYPFYIIQWL